ncbi:MAG: cyclodeaminase/cyclohydrolase family protein, partial [Candidatus Thorarchaeota archaeon]
NTITDAGVATHALMAAIDGAALNVRVNLGNIKSKDFVEKTGKEIEKILNDGRHLKQEILEIVEARMKELSEGK